MLDDKRYAELAEIFAPYYDKQLSADFIGRHDKHSTLHRYYRPVLLDIDDEIFAVAVETLIRTERMSKARRLIELYEGYNGEAEMRMGIRNNAQIEKLKSEILEAREIINEYSVIDGKVSDANILYAKVKSYLDKYPDNSQIARLKVRMILDNPTNVSLTIAAQLVDELIEVLGEKSVAYGELLKYRQDIKVAEQHEQTTGAFGEAAGKSAGSKRGEIELSDEDIAEYKRIYDITNNGYIKLEIEDLLAAAGSPIEKDEEAEAQNTIVVRKSGVYSKKNSLYRIASDAFKKIASKDDRVKERAWEIASRTRDRVSLFEYYEDKLPELTALMDAIECKEAGELAESEKTGKWAELEAMMKPHEEAVLRNLEIGLGLSVHPELSRIQNNIFARRGEQDKVDKIESLIPDLHRKPIGR